MKKQSGIDKVVELAKSVSSHVKKMDVYREAKKEPAAGVERALLDSEQRLDELVAQMLGEESNLKDAILSRPDVNDDSLSEIEWSYQKAVCFKRLEDGRFSRLFFLPFIYWVDESGAETGYLNFQGKKRETLANFLSSFVASREFEDSDEPAPEVKVFNQNLLDCLILEEEEKRLPELHQALLDGSSFDISAGFNNRERVGGGDEGQEGWTVGALPFAVIHADADYLDRIDFEEAADDFLEEFEEIFDRSSLLNYDAPIAPNFIAEAGSRHLWQKQVELTIQAMLRAKKTKHSAVIEVTLVRSDQDLVGVVMDFEMGDASRAVEGEKSSVFHRQISRGAFSGETAQMLGDFLLSHPELQRKDFKIVFGYDSAQEQ